MLDWMSSPKCSFHLLCKAGVRVSYLALLLEVGGAGLTLLLLALALLQDSLWDEDLVLGWDRAVRRMSEQSGCFGMSLQEENCSTAAFSTGDESRWEQFDR